MPKNTNSGLYPSPISLGDDIAKIEREKGIKIIRFDIAESAFPPPVEARTGTIEAIKNGFYKYSPSWGIRELRLALCEYLQSTRGASYSEEEILITVGGKFADFAFFSGFLKHGDPVVLLKPYWVSFKAMPSIMGLKIIEIWTKEPYHLDHEKLKMAMQSRPKAIVVNSPNNPTGGLLDHKDLNLLRDIAEDCDLTILSDEIDWAFVYDNKSFLSPATVDGLKERTVIADGFSKVFGMTGWRVGFAAGPKEILKKMHFVQQHTVSAPTTFAQYGCLCALSKYENYVKSLVEKCDFNRRKVVNSLNSVSGLRCPLPEGGFYVYPELTGNEFRNSSSFSRTLLRDAGVAVVPGEHFGDQRKCFRVCYALHKKEINEGLERIKTFFSAIHG